MAYTVPTPRTTGELITAAVWNTDLVDNIVFLRGSPGQSITTTGTAAITVGSGVKFLNFGNVSQLTVSGITPPSQVQDGDVLYGIARAAGPVIINNSATVSTGISTDRVLMGGAGSFIATYVAAVGKYHIVQHNQGMWCGYAPTWTASAGSAPVVGNGTLGGYYFVANNNISFSIKLTLGTTSFAGTGGAWLFNVPFTNSGGLSQSIGGFAWNVHGGSPTPAGTLHGPFGGTFFDGTHVMLIPPPYGLVNYITPFSWGATDQLSVYGRYDLVGVGW